MLLTYKILCSNGKNYSNGYVNQTEALCLYLAENEIHCEKSICFCIFRYNCKYVHIYCCDNKKRNRHEIMFYGGGGKGVHQWAHAQAFLPPE